MPERILVVDDDADIRNLIESTLRGEGYEVRSVGDGGRALSEATSWQPDLLLLDSSLAGTDAADVAKAVRRDPRAGGAAIVLVSGAHDRMRALAAAADDVLERPFVPDQLLLRVRLNLRRSSGGGQASPLTGMAGNFQVAREVERLASTPGSRFAVAAVDIDRFRSYNDHYGFLRGDDVIRSTGRLLAEALELHPADVNFAGHIGGDDFVFVTSPEQAEPVARWLVAGFDLRLPTFYDNADYERGWIELPDRQGKVHRIPFMSMSVGIATTAHRSLDTSWEATSVATEMIEVAKRTMGSSYAIDRRRPWTRVAGTDVTEGRAEVSAPQAGRPADDGGEPTQAAPEIAPG